MPNIFEDLSKSVLDGRQAAEKAAREFRLQQMKLNRENFGTLDVMIRSVLEQYGDTLKAVEYKCRGNWGKISDTSLLGLANDKFPVELVWGINLGQHFERTENY